MKSKKLKKPETEKNTNAIEIKEVKKEDRRKKDFDALKVVKAIEHLANYIKEKKYQVEHSGMMDKVKGVNRKAAALQQAATHLCFAMIEDVVRYRPEYANKGDYNREGQYIDQIFIRGAVELMKQISPVTAKQHALEIDAGKKFLNKQDITLLPDVFREMTGHGKMVEVVFKNYLNPAVKVPQEESLGNNDHPSIQKNLR